MIDIASLFCKAAEYGDLRHEAINWKTDNA